MSSLQWLEEEEQIPHTETLNFSASWDSSTDAKRLKTIIKKKLKKVKNGEKLQMVENGSKWLKTVKGLELLKMGKIC